MPAFRDKFKLKYIWPWIPGFLALLWVIARSGINPKRLTYPCQQAAMPLAANWILAIAAFFGGSYLLRRFAKYSFAVTIIAGIILFIGLIPDSGISDASFSESLPVWEVAEPVSTVFVMDSIPPTSGSLAAGNESVPDEYLNDPAIDTMLLMMAENEIYLYQTASNPDGLVGSDNIVIIKGNYQWNGRNTTNTDRVKGLIWQILNHPDGFTGEILVCDNTQNIGTGFNFNDNNSEDLNQSIITMISTFYAKGYPVYFLDWNSIWDVVADEYSSGDYSDGYIYEEITKISYPKFKTPLTDQYVSLRHGVWDSLTEAYDSSKLCIVDFPVLKGHFRAGSTIALKNWIGVITTAYSLQRFGGVDDMHDIYYFGPYALVGRLLAVTYPDLTIVDATWTTREGPINPTNVVNTNVLIASTDPMASSWYAARYVLTPVAVSPDETDPEHTGGIYNMVLGNWAEFMIDSAGIACTKDSSEMSVYNRWIFPDAVNPSATVLSPPSGGTYTSPPALEIQFHDDRNIDQAYYQFDQCDEDWTAFWTHDFDGNDTVFVWEFPELSAGTHSIFFKVIDDAGNANNDSCSFLWSFDYLPYICGDANSDEAINVSDAVYIINYVFVGGDPPEPMEAGDTNCDGTCNVSDAVWIINYVFVGGNEPCHTDDDGEPDC
jgi:Domain of unknown function (DUF362)/Dockerin type I domain